MSIKNSHHILAYLDVGFLNKSPAKLSTLFFVLLSVVLIVFTSKNAIFEKTLREKIVNKSAPIISVISSPKRIISSSTSYIWQFFTYRSSSASRDLETNILKKEVLFLDQVLSENTHMRGILAMALKTKLEFQGASAVLRAKDKSYVIINKGVNDKVNIDDIVLDHNGMLGRVTYIDGEFSVVHLINAISSRTPSQINSISISGIVEGDGKNLFFVYPTKNLDSTTIESAIGSVVTTSGENSIITPDIPIGTLSGIVNNEKFIISPLGDVGRISQVLIVRPTNVSSTKVTKHSKEIKDFLQNEDTIFEKQSPRV